MCLLSISIPSQQPASFSHAPEHVQHMLLAQMVLCSIDMHTRFIIRAKTRLRFSAEGKDFGKKILPQFILIHHVIRSNRRRYYRPQGQGFLQGSFSNHTIKVKSLPCVLSAHLSNRSANSQQASGMCLLACVFSSQIFSASLHQRNG